MARRRWRGFVVMLLVVLGLLPTSGCKWRMPWESAQPEVPPQPAAAPKAVPPSVQVPESKRVATVNQQALAISDVETAVQELQQLSKAYNQPWKRLPVEDDPNALDLHDVLSNLIVLELKSQDAQARGLDRKSDVQQRWAYLRRNFLAQEWDRQQRDSTVASEEEIHKFYEDYKLGFLDPERIQVRQLVAASLADAEAARARAVQGAVFQQLATELSIGEGKEKGGDVGWFLREADKNRLTLMGTNPAEKVFFPQLEPVAFALEKDQISQPVKGPDGRYYIVQLVERKPARQRTEVEVHDDIKTSLTIQKMQQQVEQLKKKAEVKEFADRLHQVEQ